MDKTKLSLNVIFLLLALVGAFSGWSLAFHSKLEYFKILTFVGVFFDLVGVVLLTYAVLLNEKIKEFIANQIARSIVLSMIIIPISTTLGAAIATIFDASSAQEVIKFSSAYTYIVMPLALIIFVTPLLEPAYGLTYESEKRVKIMGSGLVILGVIFQLISSYLDIAYDY